MRTFSGKDEVLAAIGETLGTSDWVEITQERVNQFADATGDHQWIHVDVERAKQESPFGGPIAHGYLTLSLLPLFGSQIFGFEGAKLGINYGSNKVRFPSPVPVGAKVRSTAVLTDATDVGGGALQLTVTHTVEVEGGQKPAVVAEALSRVVF